MTIEVRRAVPARRRGGRSLPCHLLEVAIGKEAAGLWVLEGNARARGFYLRHGFRADGTRVDEPFFGVPEIRMVRPAL